MKFHFAVIDPDQLQEKSDISFVFGVLASADEITDYSIFSGSLVPGFAGHNLEIRNTGDNLLNRYQGAPEELYRSMLNDVIGMPIWKQINSPEPSGELVMMKADLPTLPAGHLYSYIVMGLIKGDYQKLKRVSGVLNKTTLRKVNASTYAGMTLKTNTALKPVRRHDVVGISKQPIWGFGGEKVGMSSPVHPLGYKHIEAEREQLVITGLDRSGRQHPNSHFVAFLREIERRELPSIPLWITDRMDRSFASIAASVVTQKAAN